MKELLALVNERDSLALSIESGYVSENMAGAVDDMTKKINGIIGKLGL